jgi:hypothetical protein
MSYFPNAFKKVFVAGSFVTTGKTENLTAGQFGFFDTKTWTAVTTGNANVTTNPQVVLAMGSYHTVDKVGAQGGYQESIKSQIINPRQVHRFWKVKGRSAQQQIVQLGWDGSDDTTAPKFVCGHTYDLRIDLKGSPALRFLTHNMYHTFSVSTGCCTSIDTPESVDPISVLLQFAQQINEDPLFSQFINAAVVTTDGVDSDSQPDEVNPDTYVPLTDSGDIDAATGALQLTVAYADTRFGDCSFDPRDHFELEPLIITSAELTDETGDACSDFKQLVLTETQAPRTADGTGEMILRDLLLSNNYRQEIYQTDPRMREAEDISSVFTNVSRSGLYDTYYILHSAARHSNPSGIYDNDLYLIQISVPEDTNMTTFETWFGNYMTSVATGIALENLSGVGA